MKKGLIAVGLASALLLSACTTDGKMSDKKEDNFLSSVLNNPQVYSQMAILAPRVEDNIDKLSDSGANELMFYYFDLMQSVASNANQQGMYYYQDALKDLALGKTVEKIDLEEKGSISFGQEESDEKVEYKDLNDKKFLKNIKDPAFKKLMTEVYASKLKIVEEKGFFTFEIDYDWVKKHFKGHIPNEMLTYIEFLDVQNNQEMYNEGGSLNYNSVLSLIEFVQPLVKGNNHTYYAEQYKSRLGVYYTYLLGMYNNTSLDEKGRYKQDLIDLYENILKDDESPVLVEIKDFVTALKKNDYLANEETTALMDKILLKYMTQEYLDNYKSANASPTTDEATVEQGEIEVTEPAADKEETPEGTSKTE